MGINPTSSSNINNTALNAANTAAQAAQKTIAAETTSANKAAKDAFQQDSSAVKQELGSQRAGSTKKRKSASLRQSSGTAETIDNALKSASQEEAQGAGSLQGSEITPDKTSQILQTYQDNLGSQIAESWLSQQNINIPHEKIADALSQARASGSSTPVEDAANALNIDPALLQGSLGTASVLANTSLNPAVQKAAKELGVPPLRLADAYIGASQGNSQNAGTDPNFTNLHKALASQLNMTPEELNSKVSPDTLKSASQAALNTIPNVQTDPAAGTGASSSAAASSSGGGGSAPPPGSSSPSQPSDPSSDPVAALNAQGAKQQQMLAVAQQAQQNQQQMMNTLVQMAQSERQNMAQILSTIVTTSQAIYKMMNKLFASMFSNTLSVGQAWMSALSGG